MPSQAVRSAPSLVLMLGTSPDVRGGVAAVVDTLREGGLFDRAHVSYVCTHVDASALDKAAQFLKAIVATFRALIGGRVALVHAHVSFNASFWRKAVLLWVARRFRVPTIFHLHSGGFDSFASNGSSVRRWCVRRTLEASSRVIVLSPSWRRWVETFAPKSNVRVVSNPVQPPRCLPPRTAVPGGAGGGRVLFLGKISETKGAFDLLKAWPSFRAAVPGWKLVVGGNGEVERFLDDASRLNVRDDVEYLGWVSGDEKIRQLATADVFVLPSYYEGMPVSVLEAMAYGAAVVATPVGGVPDMMTPGVHGLFVRPGQVDELTEALVSLATSPRQRQAFAAAAYGLVVERYATQKVIDAIVTIYSEVLLHRR